MTVGTKLLILLYFKNLSTSMNRICLHLKLLWFWENLSVEFYTNNDSRISSYIVEKAIQGLIFSRIIFLFLWEWGFDSVYWYARLYGFETSNIAKVVDFTFDSIKKQNKIVHIQH